MHCLKIIIVIKVNIELSLKISYITTILYTLEPEFS